MVTSLLQIEGEHVVHDSVGFFCRVLLYGSSVVISLTPEPCSALNDTISRTSSISKHVDGSLCVLGSACRCIILNSL